MNEFKNGMDKENIDSELVIKYMNDTNINKNSRAIYKLPQEKGTDNWIYLDNNYFRIGDEIRPINVTSWYKVIDKELMVTLEDGKTAYLYKVDRNIDYELGIHFIRKDKKIVDNSQYHFMNTEGVRIMHTEYITSLKITTPNPLTEEQKKQLEDLINSWNE